MARTLTWCRGEPPVHRGDTESTETPFGDGNSEHNPMDAVPDQLHLEVEQQAHLPARQPEVGHELGLVDREDPVHCLQFDDDPVRNQQVNAIARWDGRP